jgi:hypothetical protein
MLKLGKQNSPQEAVIWPGSRLELAQGIANAPNIAKQGPGMLPDIKPDIFLMSTASGGKKSDKYNKGATFQLLPISW